MDGLQQQEQLSPLAGPCPQSLCLQGSGLRTRSPCSLKCLLLPTSASFHASFNLEDLQRFIPLRARFQQHAMWEKHVLFLPVSVLGCKRLWVEIHFMCHSPHAELSVW